MLAMANSWRVFWADIPIDRPRVALKDLTEYRRSVMTLHKPKPAEIALSDWTTDESQWPETVFREVFVVEDRSLRASDRLRLARFRPDLV
jgi:hypothetical protein